jgi:hypothetical protein
MRIPPGFDLVASSHAALPNQPKSNPCSSNVPRWQHDQAQPSLPEGTKTEKDTKPLSTDYVDFTDSTTLSDLILVLQSAPRGRNEIAQGKRSAALGMVP